MTDEELKAIEERANAATPGPWDKTPASTKYAALGLMEYPRRPEDRTFIAHAREDVPRLVAEVRALQGRIHHMLDRVSEWGSDVPESLWRDLKEIGSGEREAQLAALTDESDP